MSERRRTITIRPEASADRDDIRRVNELAFGRRGEADLVDALRGSEAWLAPFSLVAEEDTGIAGHLLLSLVTLDSGPDVLSLGPMAVAPDRQRAGLGTALVERALEAARSTPYPLVVVLGHLDYYPRFGFEPAQRFGIGTPYDVPAEAWMVLPLPAYRTDVRGTVRYPDAWSSV